MNDIFTNNDALGTKGSKFNEYASSLTQLLSEISANIEQITNGELKGTAVASLINSYEEIKTGIEMHIKKIDALGTVISETAKGRTALDSDASSAAQGKAV